MSLKLICSFIRLGTRSASLYQYLQGLEHVLGKAMVLNFWASSLPARSLCPSKGHMHNKAAEGSVPGEPWGLRAGGCGKAVLQGTALKDEFR